MKLNPLILAIETSLDETCAAVTWGPRVLSNVVSSQVELHKKYGGVVPIIAKRAHQERIDAVIAEAMKNADSILRRLNPASREKLGLTFSDALDAIAVTYGPGQALALDVGVAKAKEVAFQYKKPLIAVNHMEGHLLSPFIQNSQGNNRSKLDISSAQFPMIGLLTSGGHTQLVVLTGIGQYELLGETLDDAVGEAFDKVGRMIGIGYPAGATLEWMAERGDPESFAFPEPMIRRVDYNFSYSGLKTAVRYMVRDLTKERALSKQEICNIAASFQHTVGKSLIRRLVRAVKQYKPHAVLLGGGVSVNQYLRRYIRRGIRSYDIPVYTPDTPRLCGDNAAMIGFVAYLKFQRGEFIDPPGVLERVPNLSF